MIHEARIYWAAGFFLNFDLYLVFGRMEPGTCLVIGPTLDRNRM